LAESSSAYDSFETVRPYLIWQGATAHAVAGEHVQMGLIDMEPNITVPEHSHPNEQVGFILKGTFTFTIGGETRELKAGDTYVIRGGVPHTGTAGPEGAVAVDIFSPARADWEALERGEPRRPSWP
jgi:quercetin dioxygenase-like cupin family protein